ncbi:MAG: hypothetical protein K5765_06985 [Clostridia bacterium]|nr:hypothetical protein [Clostridia bacterium]
MQKELNLGNGLTEMKFSIGRVVVTRGVDAKLGEDEQFSKFVAKSFCRHCNGDWGDLCDEDKQLNDSGLEHGDDRLFSKYNYNDDESIYIITEWDRSVTTILFPEEY